MTNPLLASTDLPDFSSLRPEHVDPALDHCLGEYQSWMDDLASQAEPTWESVVIAEEALGDAVDRAWSPVAHLHAVSEDKGWRDAYARNVVRLSQFFTDVNQHRPRLRAYQAIAEAPDFADRDAAERKIVENALRELRLSGVDLDAEKRERFKAIAEELTELSTKFEEHVKDATDAWSRHFDSAEALAGLPEHALGMARERAESAGKEGYEIGLDQPSFMAVMTYADDRSLREDMYHAYVTRASEVGPHGGKYDNRPLIQRILKLRQEKAQLLGFDRYCDLSLERKMVRDPSEVIQFLEELAAKAKPKAITDLKELREFAGHDLETWDIGYYSEKLRIHRHALSDEEVRPYFPADAAMQGLFDVAGELFGVTFQETPAPVWHKDARFYDVLDQSGNVIAGFYTDLFARKGKRGGAWMADLRSRYARAGQRPVAMLNCNFPPPGKDRPSLLNHDEVATLFHEFGHGLHHMLTRIDHPAVGGISGVEWDAVELPSQFMENFTWEYDALATFAHHYESGEPLPRGLFDRMQAARQFQSGLFLVRQLEFGLADFTMHSTVNLDQENFAFKVLDEVRKKVAVIRPPSYNRFLCSFGHIFAGGYAAGYYSYLWAEQLSCDAFARFKEEGVFNPGLGRQFREEVLEVGGSRPAAESFEAFRGRGPEITPLLEQYGI